MLSPIRGVQVRAPPGMGVPGMRQADTAGRGRGLRPGAAVGSGGDQNDPEEKGGIDEEPEHRRDRLQPAERVRQLRHDSNYFSGISHPYAAPYAPYVGIHAVTMHI